MNAQLKLLIELQEMDKEIIGKNSRVAQIPEKIHSEEKSLLEIKARLDAAKKEHESLIKQKKSMDSELEDMNQRISKLKARTSEIKTNKEYQAHLKEIETAEKEVFKYEDGILQLMERIEEAGGAVAAETANAESGEQKLAAIKRQLEAESARAEKELAALKSRRADFAGRIESDIYELYMGLLQKHQGVAVAEAKNEICSGCNMKIMPQLYVQIKANDEIYQCPQCDRILYREEETMEETSSSQ